MFPCFDRRRLERNNLSPLETIMLKIDFQNYSSRIKDDATIGDLLVKAIKLEPKIQSVGLPNLINVIPYTNPSFPAIKEIREDLTQCKYDNIVLIPHCRYGGSGLVAGELCKSLKRIYVEDSLLLIRTDNDDFMRQDWFPENMEMLNLRDYSVDLPDQLRGKVLLDMLIGLKPKRIFNVHSRLAWEVFSAYGERLSMWSEIYGYTFCCDVTVLGKKVGYPISHVPKTLPYLTALLVDNHFIKKDMVKSGVWNKKYENKIVVLPTPFQQCADKEAVKLSENEPSDIKTIFWAGRFDRQKQFDIVIALAKKNTNLKFRVWGAAMLSDSETFEVPSNLQLEGLFNNYDDLPFHECDLWLYTSLWDGVPTILIELGMRAIPMVSTSVWGTADLINELTAWPVTDISNVNSYHKAIHRALDNPVESLKRGAALRALVLERHKTEHYDELLGRVLKSVD